VAFSFTSLLDPSGTRLVVAPGGTLEEAAREAAAHSGTEGRGTPGSEPAGPVLPGMPNAHSHAFQRAMAGLGEAAAGGDSFWTWRERMYELVQGMSVDRLEAVATWLYVEMLQAGYTSVAEFHYLHHGPDGRPHPGDPAAASRALLRAARTAGIRLTLLPVLYRWGGFGDRPPSAAQRAFVHDLDAFEALFLTLGAEVAATPNATLGLALHSLRAVRLDEAQRAIEMVDAHLGRGPVHIHVAEQRGEVEACLAHTGRRPVALLLDELAIDDRFALVHATHVDPEERARLAESGATVVICPTTEANLGDGLFPLAPFLAEGGRLAVGSDSQVSRSPWEELRWLEYGQRLAREARAVAASAHEPHPGARLYRAAVAGGARALGHAPGGLASGAPADLLVLDPDAPCLATAPGGDALVDAAVFAGGDLGASGAGLVRDVMVAGRWVVRGGVHPARADALAAFREAVRGTLSGSP